jgi:hypothetical protein
MRGTDSDLNHNTFSYLATKLQSMTSTKGEAIQSNVIGINAVVIVIFFVKLSIHDGWGGV